MVWKAALVFALLTTCAGCKDIPRTWSKADIEEITKNSALSTDSEAYRLANKVTVLEGKVERLEVQHERDAAALLRASVNEKWSEEALDRLYKNDEALRQQVNQLLARQGLPSIPRKD